MKLAIHVGLYDVVPLIELEGHVSFIQSVVPIGTLEYLEHIKESLHSGIL